MITIEGEVGIKATILADSINSLGNRLLTFELEYPRIILAEANTHRMLSKNSASSRAIPFAKMATQLNGRPVEFGANQSGMQAGGELFASVQAPRGTYKHDGAMHVVGSLTPEDAWECAKESALSFSKAFSDAGYHKQVFNRLTEPFQMMKTVLSGTELSNLFWLRDHEAADPTFHELARCMREAAEQSTPVKLLDGDWHLPYVDVEYAIEGEHPDDHTPYNLIPKRTQTFLVNGQVAPLEDAIKVSCARCAAVSYRNEDYGVEKSRELYDRLVGADRKHASALEHCATPMREYGYYQSTFGGTYQQNNLWVPMTWEEGITHVDRKGKLWSGNLQGWRQYRKLIPGENYEGQTDGD